MAQRTDIANIALSLLGEEAITSIDDEEDKKAGIIRVHYDVARDATLEAHEWSFAMERFSLDAPAAEAPVWGYSYRHKIPADILRVIAVEKDYSPSVPVQTNSGGRNRNQVNHVVEKGYILSDWSSIQCLGISRVEGEGAFSNLFTHAFACKLAIFCCYAITESNSKFQHVAQLYKGAMDEAKSRDGMQSSTRRMRNHSMRRAR